MYMFVCLTLLVSFFLPSHLSFKNMYIQMYFHVQIHTEDMIEEADVHVHCRFIYKNGVKHV